MITVTTLLALTTGLSERLYQHRLDEPPGQSSVNRQPQQVLRNIPVIESAHLVFVLTEEVPCLPPGFWHCPDRSGVMRCPLLEASDKKISPYQPPVHCSIDKTLEYQVVPVQVLEVTAHHFPSQT